MIWSLVVVGPGATSQFSPQKSLIQELSGSGAKIIVLGIEGDSNLVQSLVPTHGKDCLFPQVAHSFPTFPDACWFPGLRLGTATHRCIRHSP